MKVENGISIAGEEVTLQPADGSVTVAVEAVHADHESIEISRRNRACDIGVLGVSHQVGGSEVSRDTDGIVLESGI